MLLAYHLFTEREGLYASSSSVGQDPRAVAFPLSETLPCTLFYCHWDAETNRWVTRKMNSYLKQLKMVQREKTTSWWHSDATHLCVPSEFFGEASHFALALLSQLVECEGWSWSSCCCLFVLQEQELAPFTNPPSSFWGTGNPLNEPLYNRAHSPYPRQKHKGKQIKWKGESNHKIITVSASYNHTKRSENQGCYSHSLALLGSVLSGIITEVRF